MLSLGRKITPLLRRSIAEGRGSRGVWTHASFASNAGDDSDPPKHTYHGKYDLVQQQQSFRKYPDLEDGSSITPGYQTLKDVSDLLESGTKVRGFYNCHFEDVVEVEWKSRKWGLPNGTGRIVLSGGDILVATKVLSWENGSLQQYPPRK